MKRFTPPALFALALLAGCNRGGGPPAPPGGQAPAAQVGSLVDARKGFTTKLVPGKGDAEPAPEPPRGVFRSVRYKSPAGQLAAYVTPDPGDGKKRPAIVWITGGDCNSINDVWSAAPATNDQTAAAYRKAGVVMMFPSLRGGNDNPGAKEGFLGEVDDVIAAADYLAKQSHVDPQRIYLGGHSTGGTLALLVAECTDRFRAVFSFGPVDDVAGYGPEYLPFDTAGPREVELRSPGRWLASVRTPTFVLEGAVQGNADSLQTMAKSSANPQLHFLEVRGASHFSVLGPVNRLIAERILTDTGPTCNLAFTAAELRDASKAAR